MKNVNKQEKRILLILLKAGLICLSVFFIYHEIFVSHDINILINYYTQHSLPYTILILTFLLIFINISIEALKWRLISQHAQRINFIQSLKSIFIGFSISIFTPNRIGEFGGKIIMFEPKNRFKAVILAFWSNYSQLITTIIIGNIGIIYLITIYNPWSFTPIVSGLLITLCTLISFFTLMVYYNPIVLYLFLIRLKPVFKYKRNLIILNSLHNSLLNKVLLKSILRYLTFSIQYWLLMMVFGLDINFFLSFILVSVIYYIISIVPSAALSDIGVRTTVAAFVFNIAGMDTIPVIIASLVLWLFNIALPAIVGIPLLIKTRIK